MYSEERFIEQVNVVLNSTKNMLIKAREKDWHTVIELEKDRKTFMENVFEKFPIEPVSEEVKVKMIELLELESEITKLSQEERESCEYELQSFRSGRKAARVYAQGKKFFDSNS